MIIFGVDAEEVHSNRSKIIHPDWKRRLSGFYRRVEASGKQNTYVVPGKLFTICQ